MGVAQKCPKTVAQILRHIFSEFNTYKLRVQQSRLLLTRKGPRNDTRSSTIPHVTSYYFTKTKNIINIRLNHEEVCFNVIYKPPRRSRVVYILNRLRSAAEWFMMWINHEAKLSGLWNVKLDSEGFKVIISWVKTGLRRVKSPNYSFVNIGFWQNLQRSLGKLSHIAHGYTPATN